MGGGADLTGSGLFACLLALLIPQYKLEATFLEIYNETIRDLLSNSSASHDIKIDPAYPGMRAPSLLSEEYCLATYLSIVVN